MKATGIVRRIDDLGRVVIPKEIRRVLRIREGDPLEIYTGDSSNVIIKKFSPVGELGPMATGFADGISGVFGMPVLISDTDSYIAVSGGASGMSSSVASRLHEKIDDKLDRIIQNKSAYQDDNMAVAPILSYGDVIGSISLLGKAGRSPNDSALEVLQICASILAKQLE
jgi:AbrB family transcriptional regulator (stage V sporulation protein T)